MGGTQTINTRRRDYIGGRGYVLIRCPRGRFGRNDPAGAVGSSDESHPDPAKNGSALSLIRTRPAAEQWGDVLIQCRMG